MKRPEDVTLSREDGEALITRLERDALTAEDRRVRVKVLTFYCWLLISVAKGCWNCIFRQKENRKGSLLDSC